MTSVYPSDNIISVADHDGSNNNNNIVVVFVLVVGKFVQQYAPDEAGRFFEKTLETMMIIIILGSWYSNERVAISFWSIYLANASSTYRLAGTYNIIIIINDDSW